MTSNQDDGELSKVLLLLLLFFPEASLINLPNPADSRLNYTVASKSI